MIQDFEGRDINIGDEVIVSRGGSIYKVKIEKETKCHIYYRVFQDAAIPPAYATWTTYVIKGANSSKMYKIC